MVDVNAAKALLLWMCHIHGRAKPVLCLMRLPQLVKLGPNLRACDVCRKLHATAMHTKSTGECRPEGLLADTGACARGPRQAATQALWV